VNEEIELIACTVYHHLRPENAPEITRPILYPVAYLEDVFLSDVFRATNTIDRSWVFARDHDTQITILLRSTSVGDIVVDKSDGRWFRVERVGFRELTDEEVARYIVMSPSIER
jgi:hypothetical protein